jgi:hypothetical protein
MFLNLEGRRSSVTTETDGSSVSSTFNIFASKVLQKKSYATTQAAEIEKEPLGLSVEETSNNFNLRRADTSVTNYLLFFFLLSLVPAFLFVSNCIQFVT